jgi:hypothetical protein
MKMKGADTGQGEESEEDRGGASGSRLRPLSLGFKAKMSPNLLKGDLKTPSRDIEFNNLSRGEGQIGGEERSRGLYASGVDNDNPANRQGRVALNIPKRGSREELPNGVRLAIPFQSVVVV